MSAGSLPKYLEIARVVESQLVGSEGVKVPALARSRRRMACRW